MKLRLSISTAVIAFGLLLVLGFTAVVASGAYALRELKVGGPLYTDIKLGNDLIADILPPPAYVIESYLEATLAMREPDLVHAATVAQQQANCTADTTCSWVVTYNGICLTGSAYYSIPASTAWNAPLTRRISPGPSRCRRRPGAPCCIIAGRCTARGRT